MNFVKTTDLETKNKLLDAGFTLYSEQNGVCTFLNDGKLNFSANNGIKATLSNRLEI